MGAITSPTITQLTPNSAIKSMVVFGSMATAETWDATGYFTTIYQVQLTDADGTVKIASFASLTVTMGTLSTEAHSLRVWGV
jgi:hypothetical protein